MNKDRHLVYFHGYGSSGQSRKFLSLKAAMPEVKMTAFEWNPETDFKQFLADANAAFSGTQDIIVVGDSTGANFAYQFREMRQAQGLKTILVLTSPLLKYENRLRVSVPFSSNLASALMTISQVSDAFILLAKVDEVLDFCDFNAQNQPNTVVVYVDDNHRLERFEEFTGLIKAYIEQQAAQG